MEEVRVSLITNDDYETFVIYDIDDFLLRKLRNDPRIAEKYKQMTKAEFIEWVEQGVTPKQYKKLHALNDK